MSRGSMLSLSWLLPLCLAGCLANLSPDPHNRPLHAPYADARVEDASAAVDGETGEADVPLEDGANDPTSADGGDSGPAPRANGCDLTGRWIMTERFVSSALGAVQVSNFLFYVELQQTGTRLVMANTLLCGTATVGLPPISVTMDDSKAYPAYMTQRQYEGRTGSSTQLGPDCAVSFERRALLRGATVGAYEDTNTPLPTISQRASGSSPGWEDWDEDGHPGVTMRVFGSVMGKLYVSTRISSQASGTIRVDAASFKLAASWTQDRSNLGYDGSSLLTAEVGKDPDPGQHFVEFARLRDDSLAGDDAAKCEGIRALAPMLTPNAMKR